MMLQTSSLPLKFESYAEGNAQNSFAHVPSLENIVGENSIIFMHPIGLKTLDISKYLNGYITKIPQFKIERDVKLPHLNTNKTYSMLVYDTNAQEIGAIEGFKDLIKQNLSQDYSIFGEFRVNDYFRGYGIDRNSILMRKK